MPRPRSLSPAQLAAAALTVIDRDGLDGLSMRTAAKELSMSTMALYRYVDGRDELETLVVDAVLECVDLAPPDAELPWRERVETLILRLRTQVREHPAMMPLLIACRHRSLGLLRWSEALLGLLAEAGFTGERRVLALRGLVGHVTGALQLELSGPLSGPGTEAMTALDPTLFPLLSQTARDAGSVDTDREFLSGLRALLRGLDEGR